MNEEVHFCEECLFHEKTGEDKEYGRCVLRGGYPVIWYSRACQYFKPDVIEIDLDQQQPHKNNGRD